MSVKPIPDGYENVIPYLTVDDGKGAIEFYKRAFGATERSSMACARRQDRARRAPDRQTR